MERTFYEVMGVDRKATVEELKTRWRELSRRLHPDRHLASEKENMEANAMFAEVSRAYAVLSDSKQRKTYDAGLDLLTVPCGRCDGEGRVYKQKGFAGRVASACPDCKGTGRQK